MKRHIGIGLGIGWLALMAPPVIAQEAVVPPAYRHAAHAHGVPPVVLYALSLTESAVALSYGRRPWPWTLNIRGQGVRYASRGAACRALHQALAASRVVDVGLAQINVRWQPALFGASGRFARPCDALDPYANLDAAAALLQHCHAAHAHSWVNAAGCYHRPAGGAPAQRYRQAFRAQFKQLGEDVLLAIDSRTPTNADRVTKASSSGHSEPTARTTVVGHASQPTRITWIDPDTEARHALD